MESDFQREYGIDLETSLRSLTWRRFLVLMGGLSSNSRLVMAMAHESKTVTDPKAASAALTRWAGK
ncbi:bacteriophage Gp15 family protein [bacterium]|nr:bacteriophage Gp15 family protein [bacterium]